MGDSSSKNMDMPGSFNGKNVSKKRLVATAPNSLKKKTIKHIDPMNLGRLGYEYTGNVTCFLVKVAALEVVRRFSLAMCPFAWHSLLAMQVFCYPPFKWTQRWAPFKFLVGIMQKISRPLFFLSVATTFSDQSKPRRVTPPPTSDSQPCLEQHSEPHVEQLTQEDARIFEESSQRSSPELWLGQLHKELEKHNIILPERINEDELRRFYAASNDDFSVLLSSIKKTIRWRETYYILSSQELGMWSSLVFWHGYDIKQRPCLVIRLGLACSSLSSDERPRFAQAVVSQVEHGVLHLLKVEESQITVLMDCDGLSPFKFPMQMMRSCSILMQDHYPNRLGCLFILRLPPVVRMIAQTFIQVLKPVTRQKLRIEGDRFKTVLSEHLQMVPSFLGGKCSCSNCSVNHGSNTLSHRTGANRDNHTNGSSGDFSNEVDLSLVEEDFYEDDRLINNNCQQVLRTAIIALLMIFTLIGFTAVMYDSENLAV